MLPPTALSDDFFGKKKEKDPATGGGHDPP
jgi:hypothetical protein